MTRPSFDCHICCARSGCRLAQPRCDQRCGQTKKQSLGPAANLCRGVHRYWQDWGAHSWSEEVARTVHAVRNVSGLGRAVPLPDKGRMQPFYLREHCP